MNTIETAASADHVLNEAGQVLLNEAGVAIVKVFRETENAYNALQQGWAGACLARLFLRHPWLQSLRITLSASAEYNDQGGSYRSVSNAVTHVLPVPDVPLAETMIYEGLFDDVRAISEIELDLDDIDHDLYLSINSSHDDCGDVVLDLNRTAIAHLLQSATVSGVQAYRAWFPTPKAQAGAV